MLLASAALGMVAACAIAACASAESSLLFYPTHHTGTHGLAEWDEHGALLGYARPVASPHNVWLMLHGNAGQAADRAYAISHFPPDDAVYILEYPGYGKRGGVLSSSTFNEAAKNAYLSLREHYPDKPVCVVGESIGTGPASSLAGLPVPPNKIVLIVPFDKLSLVANEHVSSSPVASLMTNEWDNIAALAHYKGPVDIFGAQGDTVIPVSHAKALAAAVPASRFTLIAGGHNDWPNSDEVKIRNP